MTAGLPGAGIGGLFYLAAALLTPVWELLRVCRGGATPGRWRLAVRHFLLAASVLGGIWVTGWVIGLVLTWPFVAAAGSARPVLDPASTQVLGRHMALVAVTTLVIVLGAVELLRVTVGRRTPRRTCVRVAQPRERHLPAPRPLAADDAA